MFTSSPLPGKAFRVPALLCGLLALLAAVIWTSATHATAKSSHSFDNGDVTITEFPSFVGSEAEDVALDPSGKIVAVGPVVRPVDNDRTNFGLARYNADGSPDAAFGVSGTVSLNFDSYGYIAHAVAVQTDTRILVAGERGDISAPARAPALARYLPDGSLDPDFGTGGWFTGYSTGRGSLQDVLVQPDGKVLAAGYGEIGPNTEHFFLARHLQDGSLDPGFGTGGVQHTEFPGYEGRIYAIVLQPDNKIVAVGLVGGQFGAARYLSDGTLDPTFGTGGRVITDIPNDGPQRGDWARAVALMSDGRIVVAGVTAGAGGFGDYRIALARYMSDGTPDSTFGSSGVVTSTFGDTVTAESVVLPGDGSIMVAGSVDGSCSFNICDTSFALVRYQDNGALDTGFGSSGIVTTTFAAGQDARASAMLLQDGKLLLAGWTEYQSSYKHRFALARYSTGGSLDSTFGDGGKVITHFEGSNAGVEALLPQPGGKIVAVGNAHTFCYQGCEPNVFALSRYLADGTLDSTFGTGGKVTTTFPGGAAQARAAVTQPDGKIVVVGYTTSYDDDVALARYLPDGTLDTTFGSGGKVVTDFNSLVDDAFTLTIQSDGKIVVGGYAFLTRFLPNGTPDTSFGTNGLANADIENNGFNIYALEVQGADKVIAAGATLRRCTSEGCTRPNFAMKRYQADGQVDTTFGNMGIVTTTFGADSYSFINSLIVHDDKIVAAGASQGNCGTNTSFCADLDFTLVRYLSNGTPDTGFDGDGIATTDFAGSTDYIEDAALQADGSIVATGPATDQASETGAGLARYSANGTLDTSFDGDGKVIVEFSPHGGWASALLIDGDGDYVTGGFARLASGGRAFALAQYQGDGVPGPESTSTRTATLTSTATSTPTTGATSTATTEASSTPIATAATTTATPIPTATACDIEFDDVPPGSTFYTFVRCLACKGVLGGYPDNTFRPGELVTRGQLAKIVSNAASFSETVSGQSFEDVPPASPFYTWIERLSGRGYIGGYACGGSDEPCMQDDRPYFRPGANATRGQISKIVVSAAGLSDTPTGQTFEDVPPTHTFYSWIEPLAATGVIGGYPCGGPGEPCMQGNRPYFRSSHNVTRGQAAKIVANAFYPNCETATR